MPHTLLPDLLGLAICLVASVTDVRSFRIPNWLTLPAIPLAMVAHAIAYGLASGWPGIQIGVVSSLVGCLLLGIIFGVFGAVRIVGMGDVKLMAAVGACVGWPLALWALVYVTLAGGLLGVVFALARGRLGAVLRNIGRVARKAVGGRQEDVALTRIPYALAILIGTALTIAGRYFEVVRLF